MTIRVRALIELNGKFLFVMQRHDIPFWCLPGGRVDPKESVLDALSRELVEELGVAPIVGRLLYVHQFLSSNDESLEFFFEVTNSSMYEHIAIDKTSHGLVELIQVSFLSPGQEVVLPAFLRTLKPEVLHDTKQVWPRFMSELG